MATTNLSADEQAALDALLPHDQRSGNLVDDLAEAARRALVWRAVNYRHAGAVIAALHRQLGSWRGLGMAIGVPHATARRWAQPPWRPPRRLSHYDDASMKA